MNLGEARLVVFDDASLRKNFHPLSLTRPTFDLNFGTGTLLSGIERRTGSKATDLFVPDYLGDLARENHAGCSINENIHQKCLVVNSLISQRTEVWKFILSKSSELKGASRFVDSFGNLVFGFVEEARPDSLIKKKLGESKLLPSGVEEHAVMKYPWILVQENGTAINESISDEQFSRSKAANADFQIRGKKVSISETAQIERYVTLDSRYGAIIIDDDAQIQSFSHLTGPCFIGKGSIVKSAKIREGTTIGLNCRASGEIEESIISDYTNKNHDGFVGHSIIGSWVNLGAMTTNSDLKNTYGNIKVKIGKAKIDTGSNKVGVFIGDLAKTAIGTLLTSGKTIGVSSHVFGTVLEDVPSFTLYAKSVGAKPVEMYLESAFETQRRMMTRRKVSMSEAYASVLKSVFKMTRLDRSAGHVTQAKFKLI